MSRPDRMQPKRLRSSTARRETGLHVIEGVPPFMHAVHAGIELKAIFHSRVLLRSNRAQKYVRLQKRAGVPTRHLSPEAFRKISRTGRASGVLAIAKQRWFLLDAISLATCPTVLVLEHVRSQGNLGTILRTAEAAGLESIVILSEHCDPYDLPSVRASMGAIYNLRLVRSCPVGLRRWARRRGVALIGTSPKASRSFQTLTQGPTALLLGEEREGMSSQIAGLCDDSVSIPIHGKGDSLNIAVAAGILLYAITS